MSQLGEEDTELRDLLKQTLEQNGVLCKLRAQLRACVFLALDENNAKQERKPMLNKKVNQHQLSADGQLLFCLVREFLEYFDLDMTISVFDPESYCGSGYKYEGRSNLIEKLGLEFDANADVPILLQLLNCVKNLPNSALNILSGKHLHFANESQNEELVAAHEQSVNCKNLNETFNMSSPTILPNADNSKQEEAVSRNVKTQPSLEVLVSPRSLDESDSIKTEDTCEEASSIAEDCVERDVSVGLIDLRSETEVGKSMMDESVDKQSSDKLKVSPQKCDKPKSKSGSADSPPPLHLNKSRDTMLLPSLYSKEFKEKANSLKEIDKLLDIDIDSLDNYEEDFMSGSELDLMSAPVDSSMLNYSSSSCKDKSVRSVDSESVASKISLKQTTTEDLERKLGLLGLPTCQTNDQQ